MFSPIRPLLLLSLGLLSVMAQPPRKESEGDLLERSVNELCKDRPASEYFRLTTEKDCRNVVRCDSAGSQGSIRLATVKCPDQLAFDLERQTCDWKARVSNCDQLSKPRLVKPRLNTDEPTCPEGQLQCGSTECVDQILFCDGNSDCSDGSDENACGVDEDPNRAGKCDNSICLLPDCFCSADGTRIPGENAEVANTPQMVMLSFNGAVTETNMEIYTRIFNEERVNPNGCTPKGTFFVSHKYTNYSAVQELHRQGHEIGVFSITNNEDERYWLKGTYDDWLAEMAGARLIVERFANITDGSVIGIRAPYLLVGANQQFAMMADQFFAYDTSIVAPLSRVPMWPYTLHQLMPHKCHGNKRNCPSRSHEVWEIPINELDRTEDKEIDDPLTGCALVSSCSNIYTKDQFLDLLRSNLERHYSTNRAPLSLSLDASWLQANPDFAKTIGTWMDEVLSEFNDVYFVNHVQVIQWMQNPVSINALRDFEEWKTNCNNKGQPLCSLPNPCPLTSRELPGETIRLHTCMECPNNYPWILDPTGDGFSFK
ncbi:hypothetical protein TCAL_13698 [Tigriopus californicus]|uniref:Chitin-binding type-2 domain-containing protein n=1 Tax=Tigriopus californicus TaxID=6832 RepID=A0A553P2V2_TIGCA|nr:chitin deacetylase 1-like [Tigriopus californicus]TRY72028.1 hypothetical protein TCAL_13698 [Tigriopus californicus]|eukprot:TCALIF_13698-PA protein Name:"Protein of unknown function" AED:0.02 eAED:0.02 QI:0/-1/0/1/-1/1/1/0/541